MARREWVGALAVRRASRSWGLALDLSLHTQDFLLAWPKPDLRPAGDHLPGLCAAATGPTGLPQGTTGQDTGASRLRMCL